MNTQIINFQFKDFHVPFMVLQSIGLKFFGKIMRESCFCCSRCISFNPTSHLNSFFSYREILSNYVYKRFQGSQSIKTMVSWVFTFNKFLLTKSNFKIFTHWISIQKQPPGDVLLGECFEGVQQICGGENRCRCVISVELHMQLWGSLLCMDVLVWFLLRICETFFLGLLPQAVCFCLNIFY